MPGTFTGSCSAWEARGKGPALKVPTGVEHPVHSRTLPHRGAGEDLQHSRGVMDLTATHPMQQAGGSLTLVSLLRLPQAEAPVQSLAVAGSVTAGGQDGAAPCWLKRGSRRHTQSRQQQGVLLMAAALWSPSQALHECLTWPGWQASPLGQS